MMMPSQTLLRAHLVFSQALCKWNHGERWKVCRILDCLLFQCSQEAESFCAMESLKAHFILLEVIFFLTSSIYHANNFFWQALGHCKHFKSILSFKELTLHFSDNSDVDTTCRLILPAKFI